MNEIVWVFGPSASGKETFLKNAKSSDLIAIFHWEGKEIIIIDESIKYIKQNRKDPIGLKRKEILELVVDLSMRKSNAVIVIKGQNIDISEGLFEDINEETCEDEHKVIYLTAPNDILYKRLQQKPWYNEYSINYFGFLMHLAYTAGLVKNTGYPIITLDTTSGYKETTFPNKCSDGLSLAIRTRELIKKRIDKKH